MHTGHLEVRGRYQIPRAGDTGIYELAHLT